MDINTKPHTMMSSLLPRHDALLLSMIFLDRTRVSNLVLAWTPFITCSNPSGLNLDVKYTQQCMCLSGHSTDPDHLPVNNVKQIACVCLMLKHSARPFILNLSLLSKNKQPEHKMCNITCTFTLYSTCR